MLKSREGGIQPALRISRGTRRKEIALNFCFYFGFKNPDFSGPDLTYIDIIAQPQKKSSALSVIMKFEKNYIIFSLVCNCRRDFSLKPN